MDSVNEGSTAYLAVTFRDRDGNAAAPSSVSYRIDCLTTGQEVRGDTVVSPGSSIEITLAPSDTAILDGNSYERRRVTVQAAYSGGEAINAQYDYQVKNLTGV